MKFRLTESFSEEQRINSLANYLGVEPKQISQDFDNLFVVDNGEEYYVLEEDEAYDLEKEQIINLIDDLGPSELFGNYWNGWKEYVDSDWFEDAERESFGYYVGDIEDEGSEQFPNRLIEEMFDEGILTDDDFNEVDGEVDYKNLKSDIDIEDKKEEFIEHHMESIPDFVEEFIFQFGDREFGHVVKQYGLMDEDGVAEECISLDGVGHNIASYDGKEIDLGNGLFAYRVN